MGVPKDVPGIPGYLVLRDSTIALCNGSSWGCPRNPGILSIEGSAIQAYVMGVPGDVPGIPGYLVLRDLLYSLM